MPTRDNNILDLVLDDDPIAVYELHCDMPFSTSDHCLISLFCLIIMSVYELTELFTY